MSFIFNGVSSDTMKFNVTSRQVYNAPAYDLNAIEVPGRSGDLLNPQNRFKNKQISYTGFLKASDFEGSTWREKLSTGLIQLKGWLCSDAGTYHELTDDYDPGFTRYGYISGETAISDVQDRPFGVTLTVTLNCKPFMYKAGEPMELPETKSASGSIITITDGAENTPLKSCVVNIEPVQDLHGYDYPWPAGGGKNLLVPTVRTVTSKGITYTANADGSISLSGTATGDENFTIVQNTSDQWAGPVSALALGGKTGIYFTFGGIDVATNGGTQTLTTNVNISGLRIKVTSGTVTNVTVKVQVESGSTAPTQWTPYSNICPISGWSEVNVYADGKNMWPLLNSYSKDSSGTLINNVAADLPAGHYVVSCSGSISNQAQFSFRRENGTNIATCTLSDSFKVGDRYMREVTLSEPVKKIFFYSNAAINISDIQMELTAGTTSTGYETPNIRPITTALGQTVYGAREDVLAGKMTVDYGIATLDTSSITGTISTSGWYFGYTFPSPMDVNGVTSTSAFDGIASACKPAQQGINWVNTTDATIGYWYAAQALRIKDGAADQSLDGYRARYNGMQVVYKLATPIEVDLTPQAIKTLKGTNNIWADAGSMEIEYPIPTENPYPLGSRPLYEITMAGTGTLVVNGKEWTVTDYTGTLYCDTEAMEWYDASQLRNNIVSGDGWPVFEAGENSISYTGDITKVMVTPRWRTL